jgi:hypothetical protein
MQNFQQKPNDKEEDRKQETKYKPKRQNKTFSLAKNQTKPFVVLCYIGLYINA